ncbi:hypothetical protein D9757_014695 [Collybiopsis confluens]|uniref:DUF6533 domain-containing protein n=1 Tax=Collybiopsis confluens TaxID=2823264 RepID=A0A8H5CBV1_9AGAR|nr:hypothetical protein D9757_014695 [Collybiopsis confluens]
MALLELEFRLVDATAALFFYDYSLTIWNEIIYVRREPRISIVKVCYFFARYGAMAGTILVMLPDNSDSSTLKSGISTILRLIPIVASELLVAIRTWAIWCRSRAIFLLLVGLAVIAIVPGVIIIGENIASDHLVALVGPEFIDLCSNIVGNHPHDYIIIYILVMLYEFVTLTLSLVRIINWRKSIPENIRAPLIDTLQRDGKLGSSSLLKDVACQISWAISGVLYFSCMLVLGFVNIAIVLRSAVPQLRTGCAQYVNSTLPPEGRHHPIDLSICS